MTSACVEDWDGPYRNGRPYKNLPGRNMVGARWVYITTYGIDESEIQGLVVRHLCHNGRCVNPDHLEVGTQKQNHHDAMDAGRHPHGESHGCAKLTEEQVKEIRRRYVRGCGKRKGNRQELEREFGVSRSAISDIITRKKWAHV